MPELENRLPSNLFKYFTLVKTCWPLKVFVEFGYFGVYTLFLNVILRVYDVYLVYSIVFTSKVYNVRNIIYKKKKRKMIASRQCQCEYTHTSF